MDPSCLRVKIHYYCREKYFNKMYELSQEAARQNSDNVFLLYSGIALVLEGRAQDGIRLLATLQAYENIQLSVFMALIHAHKNSTHIDKEMLLTLDTRLKEERRKASSISLYYAADFLYLTERHEKASEYLVKCLKKDPNNIDAIILKAWNDLYMNIDNLQQNIGDSFEFVLRKSDKHIDALLGLSKFLYYTKKYNGSNLILDKLIAAYATMTIPLIEKMRNELALFNWDAVLELMERIFMLEPNNLEALEVGLLVNICRKGDYIEAADQLDKYFTCLEASEPQNGYQFYRTAQIFSRVCARSSAVLLQIYRFAVYATEIYPNNIDFLIEIAYQCFLQSKYKDAVYFFKAASKIDNNSMIALCGLTLCQLTEHGPSMQIEQQVELLNEMQGSVKLPWLSLISASLITKNPENKLYLLNEASNFHLQGIKHLSYGCTYLKKLDPDFLLQVYSEYASHMPKKATVITGNLLYTRESSKTEAMIQSETILTAIVQACPGLVPAVFELAKLKFLIGDIHESQKLVTQILENFDDTHAASHILMTQIHIQQQLFAKALKNLEACLSYNFKIRDSSIYHLLNGVLLKNTNKHNESIASFTTALNIVRACATTKIESFDTDLNIVDKATLYLELIDTYITLGQTLDAGKMMQEATQVFSYTSEECRLTIANAELALKNLDTERAIELLLEIKPGQPYFLQAHMRLAHMYLEERNDRTSFTACFKEVVANHPGADSHSMLGDAYISIFEPDLAVESYEKALAQSNSNIPLLKKMGVALVKAHHYSEAVSHYRDAIIRLNDFQLKLELIDLFIKLKQYENAECIIKQELELSSASELVVESMKQRVQLLVRKWRVGTLSGSTSTLLLTALTEAKDLQFRIVKRIQLDSPGAGAGADEGDSEEERRLLCSMLCEVAAARSMRDPSSAASLYSEALVYIPGDSTTLLALAKLYAQMSNVEKCEQTCAVLLNTDPDNEDAAIMMADLAFRKVDFDTACVHLKQLLSVKPTCWPALAQLVEVQWRRGTLQQAELSLDAAKELLDTPDHPEYSYCAGMYARYAGRPNTALQLLNLARRGRLAIDAARAMADVCFAPDNIVSAEPLPDSDQPDPGDARSLALRTGERLVSELPVQERRVLAPLMMLAGRRRAAVERALADLLALANDENYIDDPNLVLGLATAYNQLKQQQRARNILKRVTSSIMWTPAKAVALERCWLLSVEGHLAGSRYEPAKELLNKALEHNRSCFRAYEYLGFISEKEQNHVSAAHYYSLSWQHGARPDVGASLAATCLKLRRYPSAILSARRVIAAQPDHPRIRKDVLQKAYIHLRT